MNRADGPGGPKFGTIAIIGGPNAGKSSLLNQFLGQKLVIVTPKPQTTRNRISGILTLDQVQAVFLDTPGIHESKNTLNRLMVDFAWQAVGESDLVLLVLDGVKYCKHLSSFEREHKEIFLRLRKLGAKVIIAVNKIDLLRDKKELLPLMQKLADFFEGVEIFPVSALKGTGVDFLLDKVIEVLPLGGSMYPEDQLSFLPVRFFASELIREQIFILMEQELPYSTAVRVESWDQTSKPGLVKIQAVIYVSRKGQKKIVIGKNGQMIKRIGQASRIELMQYLESDVYLDLWVKIKPKWQEQKSFFESLLT